MQAAGIVDETFMSPGIEKTDAAERYDRHVCKFINNGCVVLPQLETFCIEKLICRQTAYMCFMEYSKNAKMKICYNQLRHMKEV